jgi:hypothetical protein
LPAAGQGGVEGDPVRVMGCLALSLSSHDCPYRFQISAIEKRNWLPDYGLIAQYCDAFGAYTPRECVVPGKFNRGKESNCLSTMAFVPVQCGSKKQWDVGQTLCVDLLAFGTDARSAGISGYGPRDSNKEARPVGEYR